MASLNGVSNIFKAAKEVGNDVMTLEVLPDGGIAITFKEGLKEAYKQGDPIFVDDRSPSIEGNNNAQILEQAYNNSPVGVENPDAQKLEQIFSKTPDDKKIEIDADAAYKTTDTMDIHLEHKAKIAGGVETKFTPEALAGVISQLETSYQQQTPQNPALDIPIQAQDLQMLQPSNIQTVSYNEIKPSEVTEIITQDSLVTLTNGNMIIKFDEHAVDLKKLEAQLNALAEAENKPFGENGAEIVKKVIQQISIQYPELVERANQFIVEPANDLPPIPQIKKPVEYNGIAASQQAKISASI